MVAARGALSGSGPQTIYVEVYLASVDNPGNRSTYYYGLVYEGNGGGGWHAEANATWQLQGFISAGPGAFAVPYEQRGGNIQLAAGYVTYQHDGEGRLGGNILRAIVSDPSSYIGSAVVDTPVLEPPRIPKRPTAARSVTASEVQNDSARISWTPPADDRGAAIDSYLLRYWEGASMSGPYVDHSTQLNTSRVVSGLTPGKTYTFAVYSHNGATWDAGGFGPVSNAVVVSLLAGVYVSDGTNWVPQAMRVSNGASWSNLTPEISDGNIWEEPADV